MPSMSETVIHAKASPSTLIIFEAFTLPLFVLFLFLALARNAGWAGAVVVGCLCLLIFAWWRSFSITIDQRTLTYKTLFASRQEIKLSDITHTIRRSLLKSNGLRPPNRIEVYALINGQAIEFDINMKVFRLKDVRAIESRFLGLTK
jgi:hypothetical protein